MTKQIWIPTAIKSKSALRKQLHIPKDEPIKMEILQRIKEQEKGTHIQSHGKSVPVTSCLKKRATLAMTLKKLQKKKRQL